MRKALLIVHVVKNKDAQTVKDNALSEINSNVNEKCASKLSRQSAQVISKIKSVINRSISGLYLSL